LNNIKKIVEIETDPHEHEYDILPILLFFKINKNTFLLL